MNFLAALMNSIRSLNVGTRKLRQDPLEYLNTRQKQALVVLTLIVIVNLLYLGFYRTGMGPVRNLTNRLLLLTCFVGLILILRNPMSSEGFRRRYFLVLLIYLGILYTQTFYFTVLAENTLRTDFNEVFIATNNTVGVMVLLIILLEHRKIYYIALLFAGFVTTVGLFDSDPMLRSDLYLPLSFVLFSAIVTFFLSNTFRAVLDSLVSLRENLQDSIQRERNQLAFRRDVLTTTEDMAQTGGWSWNPKAEEFFLTKGARRILGLEEESEESYDDFLECFHSEDRSILLERLNECQSEMDGFFEKTLRLQTDTSSPRWVQIRGKTRSENETVMDVRGALRDITEQKKMEQQLKEEKRQVEELASRDGLTGLYNQRELMNKLGEEIERARRYGQDFSLAFMDLDHFSAVNNQYGHPMGNEVLLKFGQYLKRESRESDIPARYGGEEFCLMCPQTIKNEAEVVLERFRTTFGNHTFTSEGETFHVTCSVGISGFQGTKDTKEALLARADEALYQAKDNGRNQVVLR